MLEIQVPIIPIEYHQSAAMNKSKRQNKTCK